MLQSLLSFPIVSNHASPAPLPPSQSELIPQTITAKGESGTEPSATFSVYHGNAFPFLVFEDGSQRENG